MAFYYKRQYRGPLTAVIVDWAGTIVDHGSRAPVFAFCAAFRRAGIELTAAEAREPMGLAKRDHIRAITRMPRIAGAWHAAHGRAVSEEDVGRLYDDFLPLQMSVLVEHAEVIAGAIEAFAAFRARGLAIGSTTGYSSALMDVLVPEARRQGLVVDAMACASAVPAGRPAPYMCYQIAMQLGLPSLAASVKIGDTIADIEEGLNAGMWTIGVSQTGNELGLSAAETAGLPARELAQLLCAAEQRLARAGAHYVVPSIAHCPSLIDEIAQRVARGEAP